LSFGLMALIGIIDFITPSTIFLYPYYVIPVAFGAWFSNIRIASSLAVVSGILCLIHDQIISSDGHSFILILNTMTITGSFVIFAITVDKIKKTLFLAHEMARLDSLTGLLNAGAFEKLVIQEMQRCRRYKHPFTFVYLDVDNFKLINDTKGHSTGDVLLQCIANIMKIEIRQTDCVARMGGDEFALLFPELDDQDSLKTITRIQQILQKEMDRAGWPVGFSMGVVTFLYPPASVDDVVRIADSLMYDAKNSGKNTLRFAIYEGEVCAAEPGARKNHMMNTSIPA
jgi:diguanylate cyclase (GGDEF)-like protein